MIEAGNNTNQNIASPSDSIPNFVNSWYQTYIIGGHMFP